MGTGKAEAPTAFVLLFPVYISASEPEASKTFVLLFYMILVENLVGKHDRINRRTKYGNYSKKSN